MTFTFASKTRCKNLHQQFLSCYLSAWRHPLSNLKYFRPLTGRSRDTTRLRFSKKASPSRARKNSHTRGAARIGTSLLPKTLLCLKPIRRNMHRNTEGIRSEEH